MSSKLLDSRSEQVRRDCICALGAFGPASRSAVPKLAEALKDVDSHNRAHAAMALASIGPEAATAVPALTEALANDKEGSVRHHAAEALGRIGPAAKEAIPALKRALKDDYWALPAAARAALISIGDGGR